jgi:hypothetical protein
MAEWVKRVVIVFDSKLPEPRGACNGKYEAVEFRLRSDGKSFYVGHHSKTCIGGISAFEGSTESLWGMCLADESSEEPLTEEQFLADVEIRRQELNGAFL